MSRDDLKVIEKQIRRAEKRAAILEQKSAEKIRKIQECLSAARADLIALDKTHAEAVQKYADELKAQIQA